MLDKLEWFRTKVKQEQSIVECWTNWNGFVPRPRVTRAEYVHQLGIGLGLGLRYDELLVAAALKEMQRSSITVRKLLMATALKEMRNAGQIGMVSYQGQGYDDLLMAAALKEMRNAGQIGMVSYQCQG
jgi:hypothetical protein